MSLSERLRAGINTSGDRRRQRFATYGVYENPYPPAGQPMSHPRLPGPADQAIENRLWAFLDDRVTQVMVVEGTQGTGKTNLLEYLYNELSELYREDRGNIVLRYYPDPESEFRGVVRRIVQDFGVGQLAEVGRRFAEISANAANRDEALREVRSPDIRVALLSLQAAAGEPVHLDEVSNALMEYLSGMRLLKRHTELLGVQFRLDTTESLIRGLHDLVLFTARLGCLQAIFLFLDELEKQAGVHSTPVVVRYLSSIRALIDALPRHLFLVVAMTPDARRRYASMLPALAGRLEAGVELAPLAREQDALDLADFYLSEARTKAKRESSTRHDIPGTAAPVTRDVAIKAFNDLQQLAHLRGVDGVTPREFLHRMHEAAEVTFQQLSSVSAGWR